MPTSFFNASSFCSSEEVLSLSAVSLSFIAFSFSLKAKVLCIFASFFSASTDAILAANSADNSDTFAFASAISAAAVAAWFWVVFVNATNASSDDVFNAANSSSAFRASSFFILASSFNAVNSATFFTSSSLSTVNSASLLFN